MRDALRDRSSDGRKTEMVGLHARYEPDTFYCSHRCLLPGDLVRGAFVLLARARPVHSPKSKVRARSNVQHAHSAVCIELSQTELCLSSFKRGERNSFVIR